MKDHTDYNSLWTIKEAQDASPKIYSNRYFEKIY